MLVEIKSVVGQDKEEDLFSRLDGKDSKDSIDAEEEEKLEELALLLMLALLDYPLKDNKYTSALISGMAVLGINY